jgi:hypothetical protein
MRRGIPCRTVHGPVGSERARLRQAARSRFKRTVPAARAEPVQWKSCLIPLMAWVRTRLCPLPNTALGSCDGQGPKDFLSVSGSELARACLGFLARERPSSSCEYLRMVRTIAQRPCKTVRLLGPDLTRQQWTLAVVVCAALAGVFKKRKYEMKFN